MNPQAAKAVTPTIKNNAPASRTGVWAGALVLVLAGALAWSGSFDGPFVFDDCQNIALNPLIKNFWPQEGGGPGIASRPLVWMTLALNHAISGNRVGSYHVLNLCIHLMAVLAFFGCVRQTLLLPRHREIFGGAATALAFFCALLWGLHPIQTAGVTYIIQRCESLMGMFFLLSLYCAIRGWAGNRQNLWHAAAVACCVLGAGAKEVIVALPVVALAYDRLFVHGSFGKALSRSRLLYAGYGVGLLALGFLVMTGGTLGTPLVKVGSWEYFRTQPEIILHYLRIALWPDPLILDYLWPAAAVRDAVVPFLALSVLFIASVWAFFKNRSVGFLGIWFFCILAPSSSFVPLADLAFLHRMYLPLAAPVVLVVLGGYAVLGRVVAPGSAHRKTAVGVGAFILGCLALLLGVATWARNADYASEQTLWADTAAKRPQNPRAHNNLGGALLKAGRYKESVTHFQKALALKPDYAVAQMNLGAALTRSGEPARGLSALQQAMELQPGDPKILVNLGTALHALGRTEESAAVFRQAIALAPSMGRAHANLTLSLAESGDPDGALASCEKALAFAPELPETQLNCGVAYFRASQPERAEAFFKKTLALDPGSLVAHTNLAILCQRKGRLREAVAHTKRALAAGANPVASHYRMGGLYSRLGEYEKSRMQYEQAVFLSPEFKEAWVNLGMARAGTGNIPGALDALERVFALDPDNLSAHYNKACLLAKSGRLDAALESLERAIALGFTDAALLARDPDLIELRSHARFGALLNKISEK